jgi:transporter family protein
MNYLLWTLLGLLAYTLVPPLMKVATSEIPPTVALLISNTILIVVTVVVVAVSDQTVAEHLTAPKAIYAYVAGLALAIGILAYYTGLSMGPVSVVTPIFGMFLVTSSVLGIAFLGETLTACKALGFAFAVAAVYLTAGQ